MSVTNTVRSRDNQIAALAAAGVAEATLGALLAGAIVDPTSTTSGTTQSELYTLNTITIPTTHLQNRAGRGVMIVGHGVTAANANNKDIVVKIGTTTILTKTAVTDSAKAFSFAIFLFRDAKDSQRGFGMLWVDTTLVAHSAIATTEDEDADLVVTLQTQNTAAAAASATGKGLYATLLGA